MIAVCQINSQFAICRNLAKKVNENVRWTPNDTKSLICLWSGEIINKVQKCTKK